MLVTWMAESLTIFYGMKLGKNTNSFCQHDSGAYKTFAAVVGRADYNKCKFIMEIEIL